MMASAFIGLLKILVCLCGIGFFAAVPVKAQSNVFETPFQQDEITPGILIKASINGSEPALFVFDTGSSAALVLNKSYKGIKFKEKDGDLMIDGFKMKQIESVDLKIKVKPYDLETKSTYAYVSEITTLDEFYGVGKIAGIIGGDIIDHLKVVIDFDNSVLKLGWDTTFEAMKVKGLEKLQKIKFARNPPNTSLPMVKFKADEGKEHTVVIDTGQEGSLVTEEAIRDFGIVRSKFPVPEPFLLRGISLGGVYRNAVARKSPWKGLNYLGLSYLRNFNVLIDGKNEELYLQPRARVAPIVGYRGFDVSESDGKRFVGMVLPEFSGSEKIQKGDEILETGDLPMYRLFYKLDGNVGEEREVKIRRKGAIKTIKYKPISLF